LGKQSSNKKQQTKAVLLENKTKSKVVGKEAGMCIIFEAM
jgi:hypothetical protein